MVTIEELKKAVNSLSLNEYLQFRDWFLDHDWEQWDSQIKADSESGKLDFLVNEAMEEKDHNQLKDL